MARLGFEGTFPKMVTNFAFLFIFYDAAGVVFALVGWAKSQIMFRPHVMLR